jgi:hypothetical protein
MVLVPRKEEEEISDQRIRPMLTVRQKPVTKALSWFVCENPVLLDQIFIPKGESAFVGLVPITCCEQTKRGLL